MALTFNTSLKSIAAAYIKILQVKVTAKSIQKTIEENPNYPSLLSLSDVFSSYNIPNSAFKVSAENFDEVESPFIAYANMPETGKDFVLITRKSSDMIHFLYKEPKEQSVSKEEFLKRYQNIVWVAEANEQSGEKNYDEKIKEEKRLKANNTAWYIGFIMLIATTIVLNLPDADYLSYTTIVLLKLVGVITTVLVLAYENNKSNAFTKKESIKYFV